MMIRIQNIILWSLFPVTLGGCIFIYLTSLFILPGCQPSSPHTTNNSTTSSHSVKVIGAMRNVVHNGQLNGIIEIDTISNKQHIFGLGPLDFLTGEILLLDGKGYKAIVVNDTMQVTETFDMKAPFFVYTRIDQWTEAALWDSIATVAQLEHYLDQITQNRARPFCFYLTATVDSAIIHIVDLPKGMLVSSPEQVHQTRKDFVLKDKAVELVGFFSTEHKGIFTHHDTFVHIHLITADRQQMGHLNDLQITPGTAKLFLPSQ